MKIKLFVIAGLLATSLVSHAETCPTVSDIKSKSLIGWKAYDSDDNKPLSNERFAQFKQGVEQFALAEWRQRNGKSGAIHCYYKDKAGSELETYLSNDNLIPLKEHSYWYRVTGFMHCAAGMQQCQFRQLKSTQTQLANSDSAKQQG